MSKSGQHDIFDLNGENPAPFKQPFLVIYFTNHQLWHIDVGGEMDKYLNRYTEAKTAFAALSKEEKENRGLPWGIFGECFDWQSQATPLLRAMLDRLEELGFEARRVHDYNGSAGPSHVLLNGALFKRLQIKEIVKIPKEPGNEPDIDVAKWLPVIFGI
jgi:hypothetical protein